MTAMLYRLQQQRNAAGGYELTVGLGIANSILSLDVVATCTTAVALQSCIVTQLYISVYIL